VDGQSFSAWFGFGAGNAGFRDSGAEIRSTRPDFPARGPGMIGFDGWPAWDLRPRSTLPTGIFCMVPSPPAARAVSSGEREMRKREQDEQAEIKMTLRPGRPGHPSR